MINKYIILIITRIIEFTIVAVTANWFWSLSDISASIKVGVLIGIITTYCIYLGVTLSNDYWELTRGEGEPMT